MKAMKTSNNIEEENNENNGMKENIERNEKW